MAYNSTMTTAAVIAVIAYRIILWAVRILWYCFKAVVNIILWQSSHTASSFGQSASCGIASRQ